MSLTGCSYVVEDITDHAWLDDVCSQRSVSLCREANQLQGTFKLFVKWKGYDKLEDQTWEEESGLM